MARRMLITCPECGSSNVELDACGIFAWLRCRTCGHRWNEEDERTTQRAEREERRQKETHDG